MPVITTFDDIGDAVEHLPPDAQAALVNVIQRRLAEKGRQRVVSEVQQARLEFHSGQTSPTGLDDLMSEIES